MIEVNGVGRTFRSVKKSEGLMSGLKLLTKPEYQETTALKDISFSIEAGAFVGLIGSNGAGKTTLLKILAGLIPPSSGTAKVAGFTPFERAMEFRHTIALVMGQKAQLWWDLPATDAFDLLRAMYEIPRNIYNERLELLSEILDVKKLLGTQIRRLSLGERMKMELIGAILHWPKVIFLDEPTIGLDVLAAQKLRDFLLHFNEKQKATIILTSHNMDDIERLCPRVLILKQGELIFDGKPHELMSQSQKRLRLRFVHPTDQTALATKLSIDASKIESPTEPEEPFFITTPSEATPKLLERLFSQFEILDMGIEEPTLEHAIAKIYAPTKT